MLRILDFTGAEGPYRALLPRGSFDVEAAVDLVRPIVADVATRGEQALREYSQRFDGVVPESLRVPAEELARARTALAPELAERSGSPLSDAEPWPANSNWTRIPRRLCWPTALAWVCATFLSNAWGSTCPGAWRRWPRR